MEEFRDLVLVSLGIGFSINILSSAVLLLVPQGYSILGIDVPWYFIGISIVIIMLLAVYYRHSKVTLSKLKQEGIIRKRRVAMNHLVSIMFDFILRFLCILQVDSKGLPESEEKEVLQRPITFTSSMLQQARPEGFFDFVIMNSIASVWSQISSDQFRSILSDILVMGAKNKIDLYNENLQQLSAELGKIVDLFQNCLPIQVTELVSELQTASHSFKRFALVMPLIWEDLYEETDAGKIFQDSSVQWLLSAFKSVSELANLIIDDIATEHKDKLNQIMNTYTRTISDTSKPF